METFLKKGCYSYGDVLISLLLSLNNFLRYGGRGEGGHQKRRLCIVDTVKKLL